MLMKRRTAIKSLSLVAAGAALFPSCSDQLDLVLSPGQKLSFNQQQGVWLEAISDAILPKGDRVLTTFESFPKFISKMLTFSSSEEDISTFVNGYNLCTGDVKNIYDSDTKKIASEQIIEYFEQQLSPQGPLNNDVDDEAMKISAAKKSFCQKMRGLSIQHLTSSKEYQEEVLEFKLVPDTYQACLTT